MKHLVKRVMDILLSNNMSYIIFTYNDINSYTDLSQYGISRHF